MKKKGDKKQKRLVYRWVHAYAHTVT